MSIYAKINELNIDLSPLGINTDEAGELYYCTPEDAEVFGWAGVDGIHYCTIPKLGEMIFAISPMNLGDCVHPIAENLSRVEQERLENEQPMNFGFHSKLTCNNWW